MQLIADKLGLNDHTQRVILDEMTFEPTLHDRSRDDLQTLLFEVLGVLTGDSQRDEFPRTEDDRLVYKIARKHLEPPRPDGLTQRLAWGSLWFNVRPLLAPA